MESIRPFLKKTALFVLPFVALFLVAFGTVGFLNKKAVSGFAAGPKVTTIFAGDSHVEQCVDDRLVPNSLNIAQNSEAYYFTFLKLQKLFAQENSIKRVFVGFSYHNLSAYSDDFIFGEFSKYVTPKYFFMLPDGEKLKFLGHNSDNLTVYFRTVLKDGLERSFPGGFENVFPNTAAVEKSMIKRLDFQFYKKGEVYDFSALNMQYLDRIIGLCREKNVELILLHTPLHPFYKSRIPAAYFKKYDEFLKAHPFRVVDFEGLELDDSCFIPDGDHVSEKGATIVSKYLASLGAGE